MTDDLAVRLEWRIRAYFDACNEGDAEKIAQHFTENAVHYFPPGAYGGAWVGARRIGDRWAEMVRTRGSNWSIDRLVVVPRSYQAVIEWTHVKTRDATVLRGDEWYRFDPASELITEIRAYYAAPVPAGAVLIELDGFDYAAQGYRVIDPATMSEVGPE